MHLPTGWMVGVDVRFSTARTTGRPYNRPHIQLILIPNLNCMITAGMYVPEVDEDG